MTVRPWSPAELERVAPLCTTAALWAPLLGQAAAAFDILDQPGRLAMWTAMLCHESGQFRHLEENLSYSAERLREIWPHRFPTAASAERYARDPEGLANAVYAGRLGNRGEASGDGWRFRGRGPLQLTGRANYEAASHGVAMDLVADPNLVAQPDVGAAVAAWYWQSKGCNALADREMWGEAIRAVNGALIGLEDRTVFLQRARAVLDARA